MFYPYKKSIRRCPQQITAELFSIPDIDLALAVHNYLHDGSNIYIIFSRAGIHLAHDFCHQVEVSLPVIPVCFGQH